MKFVGRVTELELLDKEHRADRNGIDILRHVV